MNGREALRALGGYAAEHTEMLAIAVLDGTGRITRANHTLTALAGGAAEGREFAELVVPAQRITFAGSLAEADEDWQRRLLGLFPDPHGVPSDYSVSVRALSDGWLVIAEAPLTTLTRVNDRLLDLTDELARAQRRIQQQNAELERQNQRLRELDQLKDVLLANVSHDLRTPLSAILGYAELMRRRGGLPERHARAAEVIERNARRLLRLVNDLLLLAQARAGQLRLELERVDLAELARDAHDLARPLAEQAQLEFELRTDHTDRTNPVVVEADRLRLAQLLDNLVSNAIKFTPPGGRVTIEVIAEPRGGALAVRDTGEGFDPDERRRLFEPFARGSSPGAPGTGLGLAIVQAVAEAHGAELELDSTPGSGTSFTVHLRELDVAGGAPLIRPAAGEL